MSKGISKGTLGLRFMQNALRAKHEAEVELERAKIKDEAEWEVSQEVKDAWGIGPSTSSTSTSVTHESSYLPFMFDSSAEESSEPAKVRGRRTFNARGQEVQSQPEPEKTNDPPATDETKNDVKLTRLVAISGFQAPLPIKKEGKPSKDKRKTAQELIREDVKKHPSPLQRPPGTVAGFLKPAGVDAPTSRHTDPARRESLKRKRDLETADTRRTDGKSSKKGKKDMRMID